MNRSRLLILVVILIAATNVMVAQKADSVRTTLDIFYIDVEGGAATLIVTPAGESILVDAGWPGFEGRDAKRIEKAMKEAGVTAIDHLIVTHYHTDHYGGVPELAKLVRINRFYDHGPMSSLDEDKDFAAKYAAYRAAAKDQTVTLNPGSSIRLKQTQTAPPVFLQILASRGETVTSKRATVEPNSSCSGATEQPEDKTDNARSVAFLLRHGAFNFLDTGDLTWNVEGKLVCPQDMVGEVVLFQVAHHGANTSNNPAMLRTIKPMVAIMNNGPRKGGHPDTVKALRATPKLVDLWQVHRNVASGDENNAPEEFIANPDEQNDAAHMIRVSVDAAKRTFTVTNDRNGKSKSYAIK
ncbi:MAG TPA: MBL fold metallo-hydrolase [Blastocatellia bacterium]|nr:MBL fold metallo-hydrolase [Blastocatellia bacterium]